MNEEEKERLIKKDIASIENRVRHAFNQGYEMGLKERQNTCEDARKRGERMTIIYVDDGETVKIYPVKVKVAKAVMTLLEMDDELVGSNTLTGYGVKIVDKEGRWKNDIQSNNS